MVIKQLIGVLLLAQIGYDGLSINPKRIDTLEIHNQINSSGINLKSIDFRNDFFKSVVFQNDSTLFYNPEGTLHLFKIVLGDIPLVTLLTHGPYHGHNFSRFLFIYQNNIYSFGGEGLFNVSCSLIHFDTESNEWL